jgi:hypothetical protein
MKIIALKLVLNILKKIDSIRIIIEYSIMFTERIALIGDTYVCTKFAKLLVLNQI